jgi:SAM-dependent methyltransferase
MANQQTAPMDSLWANLDDAIQKQLSLQVDLSLQRHHDFMVRHGLDLCRDVVDLGTGSGKFLGEIAKRHPATRFHGVDNKRYMVQDAEAIRLSNVEWVCADALDGQTAGLLSRTDGVLMRYFVLHLPDTASSLRKILSATRPATRLWVFDLDIAHCECVPAARAFSGFVGLVKRFCDRNGVEIRTGAFLPPILDACGFEVAEVAIEPFNNREVDSARFTEYILREAFLYHSLLQGTSDTKELAPLREFLNKKVKDASQFIQYGMVMVAAVKRSAPEGLPRGTGTG